MADKYKASVLRGYAEAFGLRTLIETGTCYGDMISMVRTAFAEIYSVELSLDLHAGAVERFTLDSSVHLFHGDSAELLPALLLMAPLDKTLVYLDAHHSGGGTARGKIDTPVCDELAACAKHRPRVVVIDDADCFTGANGYPFLDQIREWALKHGFVFSLTSNMVRLTREFQHAASE